MKRYTSWLILLTPLFTVSVLIAPRAGAQTKYSVVEVKHLTKDDSVSLSNEYLNSSYDNLRQELAKKGIFGKVVGDGDTIADSDAANAVVLECNITEFKSGLLMPPYVLFDIKLSSRADHKVIQQFNIQKIPLNNGGHVPSDEVKAKFTGRFLADAIKHDLIKSISLSSIAPAPPGANAASPGAGPTPSSATAPTGPEASASAQFSTDPTGAEIAIDGNYQGSTPSQIKIAPGTHSIKITKNGYMPWVRSINIEAGESRNFIANLEKASQ